ncbi:MAG: Crp/Fnr family transcriptional regulator [Egibacteraceae bacterium]
MSAVTASVPRLAAVPDLGEALAMVEGAATRVYAIGAVLQRQGAAPDAVHLLLTGGVELSQRRGERRLVVQLLGPGDAVGDVAVLAGEPAACTARTTAEWTRSLKVPAPGLLRLLRTRPELAGGWLASLAGRLAAQERRLADVLASDLAPQLAALLLREARGGMVTLSQGVLADLLGVHRTSINRALKTFEVDGLVAVAYRRIALCDPDRLAHLVQQNNQIF